MAKNKDMNTRTLIHLHIFKLQSPLEINVFMILPKDSKFILSLRTKVLGAVPWRSGWRRAKEYGYRDGVLDAPITVAFSWNVLKRVSNCLQSLHSLVMGPM